MHGHFMQLALQSHMAGLHYSYHQPAIIAALGLCWVAHVTQWQRPQLCTGRLPCSCESTHLVAGKVPQHTRQPMHRVSRRGDRVTPPGEVTSLVTPRLHPMVYSPNCNAVLAQKGSPSHLTAQTRPAISAASLPERTRQVQPDTGGSRLDS
jgi:hypothetical protein